MNDPRAITFMGTTDYRNQSVRFGIRAKDRLQHMYIIGKSGVGKSTLLENMIVQDIQNGNGCAFFDPHGKSAELLLQYVPEHRINDVVYFAPFDTEYPIAFNPLEHDDATEQNQRNFIADSLLSAFKKIWGAEKFSDRMEYILSMTLLALLEYPESTLMGINRMYSDKEFRARVVDSVTDITVKSFWTQTFATWDPKYAREATAAIENKIGQLSSNPLIRNIVGQTKSSFDFRQVIDSKKIFIANLSIGRIGEQNTSLLGAMLMSKLYLAAMSRADRSENEMAMIPPFYLFVDEFQNFANESFENILSQARKYKLGLTVAHQYVEQMPEMLRAAILGNIGTMCTFRIGPDDAELFEKQFSPVFVAQDFVNLAPYQVYLSLLIDGLGSKPFSARTLVPIPKPEIDYTQSIIYRSRELYAYHRRDVESAIASWYAPIPTKKDLEHQAYLEKKKVEAAQTGREWVDPTVVAQNPAAVRPQSAPQQPRPQPVQQQSGAPAQSSQRPAAPQLPPRPQTPVQPRPQQQPPVANTAVPRPQPPQQPQSAQQQPRPQQQSPQQPAAARPRPISQLPLPPQVPIDNSAATSRQSQPRPQQSDIQPPQQRSDAPVQSSQRPQQVPRPPQRPQPLVRPTPKPVPNIDAQSAISDNSAAPADDFKISIADAFADFITADTANNSAPSGMGSTNARPVLQSQPQLQLQTQSQLQPRPESESTTESTPELDAQKRHESIFLPDPVAAPRIVNRRPGIVRSSPAIPRSMVRALTDPQNAGSVTEVTTTTTTTTTHTNNAGDTTTTATATDQPPVPVVVQTKDATVHSVSRLREILEKANLEKGQGLPPPPKREKSVTPDQQNTTTQTANVQGVQNTNTSTVQMSTRPEITADDLAKILGSDTTQSDV